MTSTNHIKNLKQMNRNASETAAERTKRKAQLDYVAARMLLLDERISRTEAVATIEEAQAIMVWFLKANEALTAQQPKWLQNQIKKNLIW